MILKLRICTCTKTWKLLSTSDWDEKCILNSHDKSHMLTWFKMNTHRNIHGTIFISIDLIPRKIVHENVGKWDPFLSLGCLLCKFLPVINEVITPISRVITPLATGKRPPKSIFHSRNPTDTNRKTYKLDTFHHSATTTSLSYPNAATLKSGMVCAGMGFP